jgi:hypothetical protein
VNSAIAGGLTKALKEVPAKMKERVTKMKTVNGWMNPTNLGHYGTDYDTRAWIAWVGLGRPHGLIACHLKYLRLNGR